MFHFVKSIDTRFEQEKALEADLHGFIGPENFVELYLNACISHFYKVSKKCQNFFNG